MLNKLWLVVCVHPEWACPFLPCFPQVRHGIMLVGPSGGGKTAIMEVLAGALTELGTKHVIWRMNPKAITAPQMFGRMDATTGDWTDGIFAVLWRRYGGQHWPSDSISIQSVLLWIGSCQLASSCSTIVVENCVLMFAQMDPLPGPLERQQTDPWQEKADCVSCIEKLACDICVLVASSACCCLLALSLSNNPLKRMLG